MSSTATKIDNKVTQVTRPPKAEKVPLKLSAVHAPAELPLHEDSRVLPGSCVVAITNGTIHTEIVFHHPIGQTNLGADKWIASPISVVQSTLANAVDPSRAKKDAAIRTLRTDYAIKEGHYLKDSNGRLRLPPNICKGVELAAIREQSKTAYDAAKAQAFEEYSKECTSKNKKPKANWRFGKTQESFEPDDYRDYEKKFTVKWKSDQKGAIDKIDPPFETLTGQNGDQPQVPLEAGGREYTSDQMVDAIKRTLMAAAKGGGRFDARPAEALAAYKAAKTEAELRSFILEFCFPGFAPPTSAKSTGAGA